VITQPNNKFQSAGFTIVEVMMAALILTVGFIGMIEAVTISSSTMDHARRQTLASQIITHEIEELYLSSWTTLSGLTTASTAITIDSQFDQARLALGDDKSGTARVRFSMTRTLTSSDPVTNIREVNFTVTWVVTTSRRDSAGNPLTFTYTRANSAWYGKNGLHLSYQNS
jgi:Tfp pilus assembly protein PilV